MFAEAWRISIIHPFLKKIGAVLLAKNYHPVSNLKFVSKVMEKCVLKQFINHCNCNSLIPDYQSAYHSNYSCETAVVKLVDDILNNMESKKGTALMAIDLSAVFDMVDHDILLDVLHCFESYLRPRYCKVAIAESYSTHRKLDFSVPQGSCVVANIFNAYTSTLILVIPRSIDIHGFADDHTLKDKVRIGDHTKERKCITNLENCATEVKNWMDKNRFRMNDEKNRIHYVSSRQLAKKIDTDCLNVNRTTIQEGEVIKYLGIWLDLQLNFKHHITMKCRVAMLNLQRIKMIQKYLTKDVANTLALGLVISHLDYCNAVLAGLPDTDISHLQRIQNICGKTVLGRDKYETSTRCLLELHWLPI